MTKKKNVKLDVLGEELFEVLSKRRSLEFRALFDILHARLIARNAASGGEDMLRLRTYEKLQYLVNRGAVKKTGKEYQGVPLALAALTAHNKAVAAEAAARRSSKISGLAAHRR
ncbi:MAG TPA: hypothetical protein VGC95_08125 [Chitinophagaceae bacterium]